MHAHTGCIQVPYASRTHSTISVSLNHEELPGPGICKSSQTLTYITIFALSKLNRGQLPAYVITLIVTVIVGSLTPMHLEGLQLPYFQICI